MGFYTVYKKQKEYRYMKKTIKRKQKLGIRIGVGCALVITVILLAVQGVSNLTKKPVDTSEGIAYIKGKESSDAKTIEQKINQLEKKDSTGGVIRYKKHEGTLFRCCCDGRFHCSELYRV